MNKKKIPSILIILLSAIVVVVLFNIRTFFSYLEALSAIEGADDIRRTEGINIRILYSKNITFFYTPVEFIIFCIVALFNYSWLNKIIKLFSFDKAKILIFIASNIIIFFILIYCEKLIFNAVFDSSEAIYRRRLEFDNLNASIKNISISLIAMIVAYLLILLKKMRMAEEKNISLIKEKTKAELSALKEQISPHFFFNTLSSLSTIVRNEKKEIGLEFIQEMSKTYHYTLASKHDLVSLKEELDFLQSYLFIIKKRFGNKLIFNIKISNNLFQSKIPPMSLQLLVENAIQHNIITQEFPLTIRIFVENDMICIENNLQEKESDGSLGLGLDNLTNRYRLLVQKDIIIEKDKKHFRVKLPSI